MNKQGQSLIGLLIVVMVVGGIMGGLYFTLSSQSKIYRSNEYGVEVEYPKTWNAYKDKGYDTFVVATFKEDAPEIPDAFGMLNFSHRTNTTMQEFLEYRQEFKRRVLSNIPEEVRRYDIEEISIAGRKGYVVYYNRAFNNKLVGMDIIWFFPDKDRNGLFEIWGIFSGENMEFNADTAQQIVSTFQFVE
jgi:hypothetical protein